MLDQLLKCDSAWVRAKLDIHHFQRWHIVKLLQPPLNLRLWFVEQLCWRAVKFRELGGRVFSGNDLDHAE
jgi:hypothetical protein